MIVDTFPQTAILFGEPEAVAPIEAMGGAASVAIAARPLVETRPVSEGRAGPGMREARGALPDVLRRESVPFTPELAALAQQGWRTRGRGRQPAYRTLGDCFSSANAKARGEPLLFKGKDARTDILRAA